MTARWVRTRLAAILAGALLSGGAAGPVASQTDAEIAAARAEINRTYGQGKIKEAIPHAERWAELLRRRHGEASNEAAQGHEVVATIYAADRRHLDAVPRFQQALAGYERALGKVNAFPAAVGAKLATSLLDLGRTADAEPYARRSLAVYEKLHGTEHVHVAATAGLLATILQKLGHMADAEALHRRSLAIYEKAHGPAHPEVVKALNNLGLVNDLMGRPAEAEPLYKRSLALAEKTLSDGDPGLALPLYNLAAVYREMKRPADAEPLYRRSLAILEKAHGPDHPRVASALNGLALVAQDQGRLADAEPAARRALAIREKMLGPDHPETATTLNNLAALYWLQGKTREAEPLYRRSIAITEKALGRDHPSLAEPLNNLALAVWFQGRPAEAEPILQRSLGITERRLGADHPYLASVRNNLAGIAFAQQKWGPAAEQWRRSTQVLIRRTELGLAPRRDLGAVHSVRGGTDAQRSASHFHGLIKAAHRHAGETGSDPAALAQEMFATAQWATGSEAAVALAQMAARGAGGDPVLTALVRERQDLAAEWQGHDDARVRGLADAGSGARPAGAAAENLARIGSIDARVAEIDRRLGTEFAGYAALASQRPLPLAEAQAMLAADEALILTFDTPALAPAPEETLLWIVTKAGMRWLRSPLGTAALAREVAAIRCGLDAAAAVSPHCAQLTGKPFTKADYDAGTPLPFDATRAHRLYDGLLGGASDLIKAKHLLIVPSGALAQLPFQVLVTEPPKGTDGERIAWLARSNALTVLPAVSSLQALRRTARPSTAPKPMIGFGNPLLDGPDASSAADAKLARERQTCAQAASLQVASAGRRLLSPTPPRPSDKGSTNLAHLKAQIPLPETAEDLCRIAESVGADPAEMRLGARASEREIKALSASGALAQHKIVMFATHGAVAGELKGTSEPGLILTPPATASEADDGYLSASEIAALKLDADWVILSACNTAAANATTAEALSGLARAFLYAQARALLVSHWAVESRAASQLVTRAVGEMTREPKTGRAEALRRAMLHLIDRGDAGEAHPSFWAPFVVVGEGAAR